MKKEILSILTFFITLAQPCFARLNSAILPIRSQLTSPRLNIRQYSNEAIDKIRAERRKLLQELHPDRHPAHKKEEMTRKFQEAENFFEREIKKIEQNTTHNSQNGSGYAHRTTQKEQSKQSHSRSSDNSNTYKKNNAHDHTKQNANSHTHRTTNQRTTHDNKQNFSNTADQKHIAIQFLEDICSATMWLYSFKVANTIYDIAKNHAERDDIIGISNTNSI